LERWKPLLGNRAEIRRNASRKWWETAWPRDPGELAAPKVIALYRTNRGRFALDESGTWKPGKKCTVVVGREPGSPVAYLCGLLNSELLDMWYAVRGKTPWHDRRNYEPLRMNEIPYRQPRGDGRVDFVASLVREVAENRLRLLPHRVSFLDLGRIIKDPWRIGPVELNRHAVVTTQLAAAELVSVRLDAELVTSGAPSGRARVIDRTTLVFRRGRVETGRITGDPARIELVSQMIGNAVLDDPLALVLPKDLSRLETLCTVLARTVTSLLEEGRAKVEIIERYVCSLYNVPETLCDEVIANAVERVRSAMPED
jgi:hypothetical protein